MDLQEAACAFQQKQLEARCIFKVAKQFFEHFTAALQANLPFAASTRGGSV
jgi:hypothetical protein